MSEHRILEGDCGFCQGKPVGNAATWVDGKPRPAAPCPRCGVVTPYPDVESERKDAPCAAQDS